MYVSIRYLLKYIFKLQTQSFALKPLHIPRSSTFLSRTNFIWSPRSLPIVLWHSRLSNLNLGLDVIDRGVGFVEAHRSQ